jgi:hypothetical protein
VITFLTAVPISASQSVLNLSRLTPTSDVDFGSSIDACDEIDVVLSRSASALGVDALSSPSCFLQALSTQLDLISDLREDETVVPALVFLSI